MEQELLVKSALDSWHSNITRMDGLLDSLTDEQLEAEVAPGRNRGTYLLGHLAAAHGHMLSLLGLGEMMYPELHEAFIKNQDRAIAETPATAELRGYWKTVNGELSKQFATLQPADWFKKHTSISDEDFVKEPHRNRLNVLLSRTNHVSYHLGQMIFLKK